MSQHHLTGLLLRHPASAFAALGLLHLLPESRISFESIGPNHYPVLNHPEGLSAICSSLRDKQTWARIMFPPAGTVTKPGPRTDGLMDIRLQTSLSTDHRRRDESTYEISPLWHTGRAVQLSNSIVDLMAVTKSYSGAEIEQLLRNPAWRPDSAFPFGFFPDLVPDEKEYNPILMIGALGVKLRGKSSIQSRTVGPITLLALAGLMSFTCYLSASNRKSATSYYRNETDQYVLFPAPSRPFSEPELAAWLRCPLDEVKSRSLRAAGFAALYRYDVVRRVKAGYPTTWFGFGRPV